MQLTKNGWEAFAACQRATLPSASQAPNLLPCWLNLTRFTFANTPGGRTFWRKKWISCSVLLIAFKEERSSLVRTLKLLDQGSKWLIVKNQGHSYYRASDSVSLVSLLSWKYFNIGQKVSDILNRPKTVFKIFRCLHFGASFCPRQHLSNYYPISQHPPVFKSTKHDYHFISN